jgi:predicted amidohydrolase YtcJ
MAGVPQTYGLEPATNACLGAQNIRISLTTDSRKMTMDPIAVLDEHLARINRLGELLEQQVGPCPASSLRRDAWLADWTESAAGLEAVERELPALPAELRAAYAAWIADGTR